MQQCQSRVIFIQSRVALLQCRTKYPLYGRQPRQCTLNRIQPTIPRFVGAIQSNSNEIPGQLPRLRESTTGERRQLKERPALHALRLVQSWTHHWSHSHIAHTPQTRSKELYKSEQRSRTGQCSAYHVARKTRANDCVPGAQLACTKLATPKSPSANVVWEPTMQNKTLGRLRKQSRIVHMRSVINRDKAPQLSQSLPTALTQYDSNTP